MPTAVGTVMLLCLLPVGTMITGSIIVTFFQPGPKLTSAMQHFAAGIVLAAVAIELAPQLAIRIHGQNGVFTIAMLLGFFFAIGVLMLISRYFDADDDEDEDKKDDEVVKKKEPEIFTSNPAIAAVSTPTSAINLDIGSNKTTSTAYSSPVASPRSPMGGPSSLDVNSVNVSMPGAAPGETDGRWNNQQPGYNNNNNWNNNNNNNNNNWNNNNGRGRDESFPSQVDHIQYGARGTMDSGYGGRGTMDAGYGNRGTMDGGYGGGYGRSSNVGEGSEVSASSYSNNSQSPLTRAPNSSVSNMGRGNMAGAPPRYGGNQGGYGNNGGYNNNGNNYGRAPYPPPPGPPSMPEPEGDWNGNGNYGGGYGGNNNWNNNMYNNQRGENMYNNQNWNTRTRQRGVSQHTWQPRVRYASNWKNQGRSDMGYVPPPPPRRNGGGNNQWGNSMNRNQWNNQQNWNNTNRTMDQTHARMPSYMLHGSATTGLAKSMARNSFKASAPPTIATTGPTSFINTDLAKKPAVAPVGAFNIPWGLIVAVAVDASTDGILIGIASAVGQGGIIIAIALSIEMSFLGISTSVEMNEMNVPKNIQIPLLMVLPGFILVGGAIGATVMAGVGGALFVSFLAFGTAALLFLVVEELLISAHEDLAHDTWYVSICLFIGFMIVLIMDQFSGPNMCIDSINMAFAALNLDENGIQIPNTKVLTMPPP